MKPKTQNLPSFTEKKPTNHTWNIVVLGIVLQNFAIKNTAFSLNCCQQQDQNKKIKQRCCVEQKPGGGNSWHEEGAYIRLLGACTWKPWLVWNTHLGRLFLCLLHITEQGVFFFMSVIFSSADEGGIVTPHKIIFLLPFLYNSVPK